MIYYPGATSVDVIECRRGQNIEYPYTFKRTQLRKKATFARHIAAVPVSTFGTQYCRATLRGRAGPEHFYQVIQYHIRKACLSSIICRVDLGRTPVVALRKRHTSEKRGHTLLFSRTAREILSGRHASILPLFVLQSLVYHRPILGQKMKRKRGWHNPHPALAAPPSLPPTTRAGPPPHFIHFSPQSVRKSRRSVCL